MADVVCLIIGLVLGFIASEHGHSKLFNALVKENVDLEEENERLKQIIECGFEREA